MECNTDHTDRGMLKHQAYTDSTAVNSGLSVIMGTCSTPGLAFGINIRAVPVEA